jgi:mRNA interferase MazF
MKNIKLFDNWNNVKKKTDKSIRTQEYKERDIWWCKIGINIGDEEDGKKKNFSRPILIIKGFSHNVFWCLPLSTTIKNNKYYFKLGKVSGKEASVIISQIRLLDRKRLINKIGVLNKEKFEEIRKAVRSLI